MSSLPNTIHRAPCRTHLFTWHGALPTPRTAKQRCAKMAKQGQKVGKGGTLLRKLVCADVSQTLRRRLAIASGAGTVLAPHNDKEGEGVEIGASRS